jgi:hypothetical protein
MELSKQEQSFIRKLEHYLDASFNDFDKRRIGLFLCEFIDESKLLIKYEETPKIDPEIDEVFEAIIPENEDVEPIKKQLLMPNDLDRDMREFCNIVQYDYDKIMSDKKKQGGMVTRVRMAFARKMMQKYIMKTNDLADFFDVHYSTIHYYLYNKKRPYALNPKTRSKPKKS